MPNISSTKCPSLETGFQGPRFTLAGGGGGSNHPIPVGFYSSDRASGGLWSAHRRISAVKKQRSPSQRPWQGRPPEWYPRVPLQDITSIVKAIERRRGRLREGEGPQVESPGQEAIPEPRESTPGEQASSSGSRAGGHVSAAKMLLDITRQNGGDMAGLTLQKKLLKSIDTFEEVVLEELKRMNKTPAAKKAERKRKVKILKSMR